MTGIDNTVLAEALRLLSPYRDQGRVWDTLEELIAAPPAQREAILRQPRQQEPSTSESTKGRFFNGHNKKSPDQGSTNFAWWPEDDRRYPGQQFEKMLTAQFLWYATHTLSPAQGDKGNAATWTARAPEDAWDVVESVCRKYRVPRQTVSALHAKGGPREWVGEMIRQAKLASANHAVAQKTLAKQQGSQPGAAPSRWDSAYRQPPGAEDDPPYGDLDRPAALLEGRRLDRPHPAFLPWQPPENWDLVGPYSGSLVFADGTFLDLPYLELFGGEAPGEAEFVEGENLLCRLVDTDAHLEQQVTALSYPAALAEEEAAARALGYTHHPPSCGWTTWTIWRTPRPPARPTSPSTWGPRTTWATGSIAGRWLGTPPPRPPFRRPWPASAGTPNTACASAPGPPAAAGCGRWSGTGTAPPM